MTKQIIRKKLEEVTYSITGDINEVISFLESKRREQQRSDSIRYYLEKDVEYGCNLGEYDRDVVYLYEERCETDKEYKDRLDLAKATAKTQRDKDLEKYLELQKKLGFNESSLDVKV